MDFNLQLLLRTIVTTLAIVAFLIACAGIIVSLVNDDDG